MKRNIGNMFKIMMPLLFIVNIFTALPGRVEAASQTIVFQQGSSNAVVSNYQGNEDTTIQGGGQANDAMGSSGWLEIGSEAWGVTKRFLSRYDLTAMKNTSPEAISATLTFKVATASDKNLILKMYRITDADSDWQAGSADGASVYNQKHRGSGTNGVSWAGGAGMGNPGAGSYEATPLAVYNYPANSTQDVVFTIPGDVITDWIQGKNTGLLFRGEDEAYSNANRFMRVYSANAAALTNHPTLAVTYDDTPDAYNFLSTQYSTAEGAPLTIINPSTASIQVTAQIQNYTRVTGKPTLIVALYDGNTNTAKAVAVKEAQNDILRRGGTDTLTALISAEQIQKAEVRNGDYIKMFIWNSLTGMEQLGDEIRFPR